MVNPLQKPETRVVRVGRDLLKKAIAVFEAEGRSLDCRETLDAGCTVLIQRSKGFYLTVDEAKNVVRVNLADNLSGLLQHFLQQSLPDKEIHVSVEVLGDQIRALVEVDGVPQQLPAPAKDLLTDYQVH